MLSGCHLLPFLVTFSTCTVTYQLGPMENSQSITIKHKQTLSRNRDTFELLHMVRRVCGFTPFKVYHEDEKSYLLSVKVTLRDAFTFALCVATYTFFGVRNYHYRILFNMSHTFVSDMGTILVSLCGFLIAVGCPIMNVINRKRICKLFNMVEAWDVNVSSL